MVLRYILIFDYSNFPVLLFHIIQEYLSGRFNYCSHNTSQHYRTRVLHFIRTEDEFVDSPRHSRWIVLNIRLTSGCVRIFVISRSNLDFNPSTTVRLDAARSTWRRNIFSVKFRNALFNSNK